jgi:tryptophan-rich sensory protein
MLRLITTIGVLVLLSLMPKRTNRSSAKEPPGYVFSVVWTILFLVYGISWEYVARHGVPDYIDMLFWVTLILNLVWAYVYFVRSDMLWSKILLAIMIIVMYLQIYTLWFRFPKIEPNYVVVVEWGLCVYISWLLIAFFLLMGW